MAESLKDFSLRIYRADTVRGALLDLQDEASCDVTVVLWALWLAAQGRKPGDGELEGVLDWSRNWGAQVTAPLRQARRAAKSYAEGDEDISVFRQRLKTEELDSEIITLERLERLAPGQTAEGNFTALAASNLQAYAKAAGLTARFDDVIAHVSRAAGKV